VIKSSDLTKDHVGKVYYGGRIGGNGLVAVDARRIISVGPKTFEYEWVDGFGDKIREHRSTGTELAETVTEATAQAEARMNRSIGQAEEKVSRLRERAESARMTISMRPVGATDDELVLYYKLCEYAQSEDSIRASRSLWLVVGDTDTGPMTAAEIAEPFASACGTGVRVKYQIGNAEPEWL